MRPFSLEQVAILENLLKQDGSATALRDLALLRVGIDTALRSSDVLALSLDDVFHNGIVADCFSVRQEKTKREVRCELCENTRTILKLWIELNGVSFSTESRIFPISTRQHQRIVKTWCDLLKLDGRLFSTHSIRRTKPAHLYAKTKNLAAAKAILGHDSIASTGKYLGVESADAFELAKQYPI